MKHYFLRNVSVLFFFFVSQDDLNMLKYVLHAVRLTDWHSAMHDIYKPVERNQDFMEWITHRCSAAPLTPDPLSHLRLVQRSHCSGYTAAGLQQSENDKIIISKKYQKIKTEEEFIQHAKQPPNPDFLGLEPF